MSANVEPPNEEACGVQLKIMKLLMKHGANAGLCEKSAGCTPLHYAASTGNMEKAKMLLANGSKASAKDRYSFLPHDYAVNMGQTFASLVLLSRARKRERERERGLPSAWRERSLRNCENSRASKR